MPRLTVFSLFYSSTFTLLSLVTLALVLVPPSDAIAQVRERGQQLYNVFVIAGVYILTAALAVILYTSRMYTFRRLLSDIPKPRPPVSRSDLPRRMHCIISKGLSRSAEIAVSTRPALENPHGIWGPINHPGWASPTSDLAGVEYRAILNELPGMLEHQAITIVRAAGIADVDVVIRAPNMTLRLWLEGLVAMELAPANEVNEFLEIYERARFRMQGKGITEDNFRALMKALKFLLAGFRGGTAASESIQDYSSSIVRGQEYPQYHPPFAYESTEYGFTSGSGYTDRLDSSSVAPDTSAGNSSGIIFGPRRRRGTQPSDSSFGTRSMELSRGLSMRASTGTIV